METLPRGIRNNNPLNLRKSNNDWKGKVINGTDRSFEQFISVVWGLRAAMINIRTYVRRHHANYKILTLSDLIRIWAPASDGNNVDAYIKRVCTLTHFERYQRIFFDHDIIVPLVKAMSIVENGKNYLEDSDLEKAWLLV